MSGRELFDVTVVGGGPTGLYTAFYGGMRDLRVKVLEAQPYLGGKLHAYPEKVIWDIGGLPPTRGEAVIEYVIGQGLTFEPEVVLGRRVVSIVRDEADGTFTLGTACGEEHRSRTVILAVGHGVLDPRRLEIEGAERFEVTNLRYTVGSLDTYRGKRVLISGGGDTALDWANAIEPLAASVTLVHRREEFAAHESSVSRMKASTVRALTPFEVTELRTRPSGLDGTGDAISSVLLTHTGTSDRLEVEVDEVIVNHGYKIDLGFLKDGPFPMRDEHLLVNEHMETGVPGVYAAGDVTARDGKVHLISGGFVEGATALNSAKLYLDPAAEENAFVSSHNERFAEKNKALLNRTP
ncbi:Thioredoxin reductase (plasmid) [Rubrobacter radiotolerans]|uniref:Ferredoxin--NADP reductase n=1 Tax=Rubrobacter radiotolerans TaxID=42256 RepID=A0A023X7V3_RUBRA|nr:NAD(P)/FAD-dependent oxidoreductase [Rubrobacter radiotolerans]AHY48296.1 Thioredoxin reductase [Rubrobacter radiotolerans]MDX5895569.1 NAD(P)/FAD-dependent oxidoreductase [Rubrobacter radiotolerans]SMC01493.1 thioredoxin reductase (NADPH) [Rubrobacter radiotolerans DSM 5868]